MLQHYTKPIYLLIFFFFQHFVQAAPPTKIASGFNFSSIDGNGFTLSFTKGDGLNRIIVIKKDVQVTFQPTNGGAYTANNNISASQPVIADEYIVYDGSGNGVTITGLLPNTTYHLAIFEYNGSGNATEYLVTPARTSRITATTPVTGATNMFPMITAGNYLRLGINVGSGEKRLVLMRKGEPVNAAPADLTSYSLSTTIGTGNIVVFNGSGNVFDLNNLTTSTDYHFAVFEYNGISKPVYQAVAPTTFQISTNERPTVNSTNFVTEGREGDRISIRYKLGNGRARVIVAREGQAVTATPVDGTNYSGYLCFSGTGSSHLGDGQYVIYNGFNVNDAGSNSMTMTTLQRYTTYHFAIFEYDYDANGKPVYLTTSHASTSGSTENEPGDQAKDVLIENITDKGATIKFTAGNGMGRLLIGRRGAPVNVTPTDLTNYMASINFGSGTVINGDNYVIADAATASSSVQRLQSSTDYHFAVFEYNGYLGKLYQDVSPARGQMVTAIRPTIAASSMSFSNLDGDRLTLSWNNGNGKGRVIVARKASAVTVTSGISGDLKDNTVYTSNAEFGKGTEIKPGEFVVYNDSIGTVDSKNTITITGLEPNTIYHFAVYEYGQLNGILQYATASPGLSSSLLIGSSSTAKPPTSAARFFTISNIANRSMSLSWITGSGDMRIVVAKEGSAVDAVPADLFDYTADVTFGVGTEIGSGNFVVYKGSGASFNLAGLKPGTTYHFAVFEANGKVAPVFQNTTVTAPLREFKTTLEKPTVAPSGVSFSNISGSGFTITWARGNGGKSLVVMRAGTNVTFKPVDGSVYNANASFGTGVDVSTDQTKQYVVYNGDGNTVEVTGLQPASTYYVAIYEFEEPLSVGTAYLTSSFATGFKQIVAAPLQQSSSIQLATISSSAVKLDLEMGSGQKRIILAKEDGEVNAAPDDNTNYTPNSSFGSGQQIGSGNFVVYNGTGNSVNITSLKQNKTYHFAVFEYNQYSGGVVMYQTINPAKAQITLSNPLPVTWLNFTATRQQKDILLDWKTTAETANQIFEVERSANGINFSKIGTVPANSLLQSVNSYSFRDQQPLSGHSYYRIKQVDANGNFTYSKVVQMKAENGTMLIMENPVRTQLNLKFNEAMVGGRMQVADASGKMVYQGVIKVGLTSISVSHLPRGVYYLKATNKEGTSQVSTSFVHQ